MKMRCLLWLDASDEWQKNAFTRRTFVCSTIVHAQSTEYFPFNFDQFVESVFFSIQKHCNKQFLLFSRTNVFSMWFESEIIVKFFK